MADIKEEVKKTVEFVLSEEEVVRILVAHFQNQGVELPEPSDKVEYNFRQFNMINNNCYLKYTEVLSKQENE